jgi:dihydroxy-acid dehydratase
MDPRKDQVALEVGRQAMEMIRRNVRPRDIITREAIENAIAGICSSGGSTNGVLHLLAIAREAGVELDIDDFDRISEKTPIYADLKPAGRFVANDLYEAGGIRVMANRMLQAGLLNANAMTVSGRTIGEEPAKPGKRRAASRSPAGQALRHRWHGSAGNLSPEGCVLVSPPRARCTAARPASSTRRGRHSGIRRADRDSDNV